MTTICIDVDDKLLKDFRTFVVAKHGRIYGVLKPEVEAAMANHIKRQNPLSGGA
jgi:hypothetical protein